MSEPLKKPYRSIPAAALVITSFGASTTLYADTSKADKTLLAQRTSQAGSQTSGEPATSSAPYYNVLAEGKTLPSGVARVRLPLRLVSGDYGYDQDGKKTKLGAKLNATGSGLVFEYGATDRLSLQFLAPYIISNELGLDTNKFRQSEVYKKNTQAFIAGVAAQLKTSGVCASDVECSDLINSGFSFPADQQIPLPSGEVIVARAGVPVRAYADSLVATGATPVSGEVGLGDIQVGFLYGIVTEGEWQFAAGAGFRFPTGSFEDVPTAKRPTGRGTTDFGVRTNIDYLPTPGFVISWQNQAEMMVAKGKKNMTSLLDASKLDEAGQDNEQDFERAGLRHVGFVKGALGLGLATQALRAWGVWTSFDYDLDPEKRLDGTTSSAASRAYTVTPGVGFSGFPYAVPVTVDLEYSMPVGGKNLPLATNTLSTTLKAYYRF